MFQRVRFPAFALAFVSKWLFFSSGCFGLSFGFRQRIFPRKSLPGFVKPPGVKLSWTPSTLFSWYASARTFNQFNAFETVSWSLGFVPPPGVKIPWPLNSCIPHFSREAYVQDSLSFSQCSTFFFR